MDSLEKQGIFDSGILVSELRALGDMVQVASEVYIRLPALRLKGASTPDDPKPETIIFSVAGTNEAVEKLSGLKGCVLILPLEANAVELSRENCVVHSKNPKYTYACLMSAVYPFSEQRGTFTVPIGQSAFAAQGVTIAEGVIIEPFVTIARGSSIGPGCHLLKGCSIGPGVRMGRNCVVKEGAVVGDCGFGYGFDKVLPPVLIPQIGGLHIGDRVEIGALSTISVGTINPTVIEDDVKINNHVHVAHNCGIGEQTIVNAGVSISGSSIIGKRCWLAPGARVRNKVVLGDGVTVGMGAVVVNNIEAGVTVIGVPAKPVKGGLDPRG